MTSFSAFVYFYVHLSVPVCPPVCLSLSLSQSCTHMYTLTVHRLFVARTVDANKPCRYTDSPSAESIIDTRFCSAWACVKYDLAGASGGCNEKRSSQVVVADRCRSLWFPFVSSYRWMSCCTDEEAVAKQLSETEGCGSTELKQIKGAIQARDRARTAMLSEVKGARAVLDPVLALAKLEQWVLDNGGRIAGVTVAMDTGSFAGPGRKMLNAAVSIGPSNLASDFVVLAVPGAAWLSPKTLYAHRSPVIRVCIRALLDGDADHILLGDRADLAQLAEVCPEKSALRQLQRGGVRRRTNTGAIAAPNEFLALSLLYELQHVSISFWGPYLKAMVPDDADFLWRWTDADLIELQSPLLRKTIAKQLAEYDTVYDSGVAVVLTKWPDLFPNGITKSAWRGTMGWINTHQYSIGTGFIPLGDLPNHSPNPNAYWSFDSLPEGEDIYQLVLSRPVTAGEPIQISYGDMLNGNSTSTTVDALLLWGYIPDTLGSMCDWVMLQVAKSTHRGWLVIPGNFLQNALVYYAFQTLSRASGVPTSKLATNAAAEAQDALAGSRTTLEHDETLLRAPRSIKQLLQLQVRVRFKRVLTEISNWIGNYTELCSRDVNNCIHGKVASLLAPTDHASGAAINVGRCGLGGGGTMTGLDSNKHVIAKPHAWYSSAKAACLFAHTAPRIKVPKRK